MSFIKTNDRLVNLKNVSNINILEDEKRIVFNLNYSIEIEKRGQYKYISDYVYWDLIDDVNFQYGLGLLYANQYIEDNFLVHPKGYINKNEVSSVKFSDKKNRVIFNLSHPVTFVDYNGYSRITSEFVYVDIDNSEKYSEYTKQIKYELTGE